MTFENGQGFSLRVLRAATVESQTPAYRSALASGGNIAVYLSSAGDRDALARRHQFFPK